MPRDWQPGTPLCASIHNPPSGCGSAPRTPAPLLFCRAALAGRKAARAVLPALGGRAHPCARLGLAPVCAAGLRWSPCGCGRAVGRVAPGLGGFSGRVCGVCRGFVLGFGFACAGGFPWFAGVAAVGAVVASAGRVRPGRWRVSLAGAGLGAVVRRGGGRRRVPVGLGGLRVRGGLVGLGWLPARRSPLCWRGGSGLGRLGAGGRAAICPAVAASGAACARLGFWRLGWRFLSPPWRAARRRCRRRWPARRVGYSASSPTGSSNRCRAAAFAGMKFISSGSSSGTAGSASGHSFARQHASNRTKAVCHCACPACSCWRSIGMTATSNGSRVCTNTNTVL